jgi:2-keto-4-pentenoate hydratase/2-oxohepta-3-ene-1,7-dioic acid hydratase in catechol pathway
MQVDVWTKVNGRHEQQGNTNDMLFPVHAVLAYSSRHMRMVPGDVLGTVTPPGVGWARIDTSFWATFWSVALRM